MIRIAVLFAPNSSTDRDLFYEFQGHLASLVDQGIRLWHIDIIPPGDDREELVRKELYADLILCLVSPDFILSEFCSKARFIADNSVGDRKSKIVPILIRSCLFDNTYFERLQFLPRDLKAVASTKNRGTAWANVIQELRLLISDIRLAQAVLQGKKEVLEMVLDSRGIHLSARGRDAIRSIDNSYSFIRIMSRVLTCKDEFELLDDRIF